MKISAEQYAAACSLTNYGAQNGKVFSVSTSEYSMDDVRRWANEHDEAYFHAPAATMRGFAKRGLIDWDQSWRCGTAIVRDVDALRAMVQNGEIR